MANWPPRGPFPRSQAHRPLGGLGGDHQRWKPDIEEFASASVDYPIIADPDKRVAELYDMIHPNQGDTSSVRSVFIIDPAKKIRLTMTYPKSVGRNFEEILRSVDALQTTDRGACSTPVDWKAGDKIIVPPTLSTDDARERFDDVEEFRPYLRRAAPRLRLHLTSLASGTMVAMPSSRRTQGLRGRTS